jgi:hypothetical protein
MQPLGNPTKSYPLKVGHQNRLNFFQWHLGEQKIIHGALFYFTSRQSINVAYVPNFIIKKIKIIEK